MGGENSCGGIVPPLPKAFPWFPLPSHHMPPSSPQNDLDSRGRQNGEGCDRYPSAWPLFSPQTNPWPFSARPGTPTQPRTPTSPSPRHPTSFLERKQGEIARGPDICLEIERLRLWPPPSIFLDWQTRRGWAPATPASPPPAPAPILGFGSCTPPSLVLHLMRILS